jgi:DNA repair photolyase
MAPPLRDGTLMPGHGALSNPAGRFERHSTEAVDDGWFQEAATDGPPLTVTAEHARALITTNDSPDIPFEQSINPYRGCSHACVYCYARPSHAYMGLSAGLDFETKLFYKADAAELLQRELARPGYRCKPITLGANTDPYQPIERQLRLTRAILEVLAACRHPVTIITKSALVLRELDLLSVLAKDHLVQVGISITTLDAELKRRMEPQTASPAARLRTVRELTAAGIPAGVLVAPVIPALTDHEMERILEAAAAAGARWAGYVLLRLPYELRALFSEWLDAHYPDRAAHVLSLIRQMRNGRENDPRFGTRMRGEGPFADMLRVRFQAACRRTGLNTGRDASLEVGHFRRPGGSAQLTLGF